MAFGIFISYSTKDLEIVNFVQSMLVGSPVKVFVAEYSVTAGQPLSPMIVEAIKACDLFLLLWSTNSQSSEWVPQEIGIAKAANKQIVPVVLQSDLKLPGFIRDLKYLDVQKDPATAFDWLKNDLLARATEKQKQEGLALMAVGGALLWLFSQK